MREGEKWDVRYNIDLSTFGHSRNVGLHRKCYDNFVALNALCNDTWIENGWNFVFVANQKYWL